MGSSNEAKPKKKYIEENDSVHEPESNTGYLS